MLFWNGFFYVGTIKLTSIYMVEWCNELFLVRIDLVNCYILKRLLVKKKVAYEKIKVCDLRGMSQPHFGQVWGEAQHLEKLRIWSPLGLPNVLELNRKAQNTAH
jgi:hypothetical protein